MEKSRKEEVREARAKFKKDPIGHIVKTIIDENDGKIGRFLWNFVVLGLIPMFLLFAGLKWVDNQVRYCEATEFGAIWLNDTFARVVPVWNERMEEINSDPLDMSWKSLKIKCYYDLDRRWKELGWS